MAKEVRLFGLCLELRATEAQVHRLEQIGYRVAQLHETATFLSTFATAEALAGHHSVQTLEQELKNAGGEPSGDRRVAGNRPQRGRPPDLGAAHRGEQRQRPQTSVHGLSSCAGMDRGRSALSAGRPSGQKRQPGSNQAMAQPGRDLGCAMARCPAMTPTSGHAPFPSRRRGLFAT